MNNIYCPNKNYKYYGIINGENLHLKQIQGVTQKIKLVICKVCGFGVLFL